MARYSDGLRIAVSIFEAAAWRHAIKVICSGCRRSAVFNAHALWGHFQRRGLDDRLNDAHRHFWCRRCGRGAAKPLELVREQRTTFN